MDLSPDSVITESFDDEVIVRHVRYANEASGWAVLDAVTADGTPLALVGPLVHLERGERVHVLGAWVTDSRYGRQVKVSQAEPLTPQDPEALLGYLVKVKHVGAKRAARLIGTYGAAQVFDAIDGDPVAAFEQVGLRGGRAREAAESWESIRVTRRLHLLLAPGPPWPASLGSRLRSPGASTSCWRHMVWPTWRRGSTTTTGPAPTSSSSATRTS